jgi:hypothetical protein
MKKSFNKYSKLSFLFFWIASQLMGFEVYAKSTKEVWLEFTGSNYCQESFCADGIPSNILEKALNYYSNNRKLIKNDDYLAIIDFTKLSTEKRFKRWFC